MKLFHKKVSYNIRAESEAVSPFIVEISCCVAGVFFLIMSGD